LSKSIIILKNLILFWKQTRALETIEDSGFSLDSDSDLGSKSSIFTSIIDSREDFLEEALVRLVFG